ncbi:hypothetical protein BU17DRAFT_35973 [Hysterangium stoloniferum]|nr:hypothetical protein BU17DRAFT_35973 [Hysterangium stoloniferum]
MPKTPSTRPSKAKASVVKTDIIISIKGEHMNNIVSRKKNHEFRKYLIPDTIERMWYAFYVSSPDQTLRYVAEISRGKVRGEVKDEEGLGNTDFNQGLEESKFAYEILHLYKVKEPPSSVDLKNNYSLSPPQRYTYLPQTLFNHFLWQEQEKLF